MTSAATLLLLLVSWQVEAAPAAGADLVLVGGNLLDVESGETLRGHDLWIEGDRITAIVASGSAIPEGATMVDLRGRFLLPGLVDAHVHLDHVDELELYLSQGVTTVFNLRGVPRHLTWREAIRRGERVGPTIYTAGDYMDGYPPYMEPMLSFDSPEAAAESVRAQAVAGYDMVKVYSRLSLEQLGAITAAAAEVGLPVVGHGSQNYTLEELVGSGQLNLAHGQELGRWYGDPEGSESRLDEMVAIVRGSGLTITPNLSWTEGLIRQASDLEGLLEEPIARALPAAILQPFRRANNRYVEDGVGWLPSVTARLEREKLLTRKLHAAGVPLLTGTDASTSGVLPGTSLHHEVSLLVEAGLSPLDALRAATLAAGRFVEEHIDEAERFGRLAEGYRADVLVLADDPLEDVGRLSNIVGVVARGRWHDRKALDARVAALSEKSLELTPIVIELEDAIKSGDLALAREVFDAMRSEDPEVVLFSQYVPFFIGYGSLYGQGGFHPDPRRRKAALTLYEMYAETYPEYHSAHYMLGLARLANDDPEGAVESLQRALRIHPAYRNAREKLAELESD